MEKAIIYILAPFLIIHVTIEKFVNYVFNLIEE